MEQHYKEQLETALLGLEKVRLQIQRLEAHIESEQGTQGRTHKRIYEDIQKLEEDFKKVLFDPITGLMLKVDRLEVEALERKKQKQHNVAVWIAIAGIAIKEFIDWIKNK